MSQMLLKGERDRLRRKEILIKLTSGEVRELKTLVDHSAGRGGFQNLLLYLWYQLDDETGELPLNHTLMERINRYAFRYNNTYWRRTLRRIFRRTLGAHLDRGLTLR
jgi:hypothetical protein